MDTHAESYVVILARGHSAAPWAMRNPCNTLNASLSGPDKRDRLIAAVKAIAQGWTQVEPATAFAVAEVTWQGVRSEHWTVLRFLTGAPILYSGDAAVEDDLRLDAPTDMDPDLGVFGPPPGRQPGTMESEPAS